jgi:hypothetical protein
MFRGARHAALGVLGPRAEPPEAEAIHNQVARGEITSEEAIEIFRQRVLAGQI